MLSQLSHCISCLISNAWRLTSVDCLSFLSYLCFSPFSLSFTVCIILSLFADIDMKDLTELRWPPPVGQLEEEPICGEQGKLWPLLPTAAPLVSCICRALWVTVLLETSRLLPIWFKSLPLMLLSSQYHVMTTWGQFCLPVLFSLGRTPYYNSSQYQYCYR